MTRSASNDYRIGEGSGYNRAANAPEGAAGSSNRSTYFCIAIATFTAAWFAAHFIAAWGQL